MLRIGKVLKSNGTQGELVMSFLDILPEDIDLQEPVFIEFDGLPVPFYFESFTPRGNNRALVTLTGWVQKADGQEVLLPLHEDLLKEVDEEKHLLTLVIPDGILDL